MEQQPLTEPSFTEQPYLARRRTGPTSRTACVDAAHATALRFLGHTTR